MRLRDEKMDGVMLDTPLDGVMNPWHGVDLAYGIRRELAGDDQFEGLFAVYNAGDADSWMGRTPQWAAMYDLFSWHLVEVWIDINNYDIQKLSRRTAAVTKAISEGKNLILGIYDNGMKNAKKAADLMRNNPWGDNVYWLYKVSPTECILNPELKR
jgi:hypothetical protein